LSWGGGREAARSASSATLGLLFFVFEDVLFELECVALEVEFLEGEAVVFVGFAVAELAFLFLDSGVALADSGVFGFVDEVPEFFEAGEVFGMGVAGGGQGEVEGFFFEEVEGGGGEGGVTSGGKMAELGGEFAGGGGIVAHGGEVGALEVAVEGHAGDFAAEFVAAKLDDFAVGDEFLVPGVEEGELVLGEVSEAFEGAGGAAGGRRGVFDRINKIDGIGGGVHRGGGGGPLGIGD